MSPTKGDFVWVKLHFDADSLAIFLGRTYGELVNSAEVFTCDSINQVGPETVDLKSLSPASTGKFKKKHLREAIFLLSHYFRNELEECLRK